MPSRFTQKVLTKTGLILGWLIIAFAGIPKLLKTIFEVHPPFLQSIIAKHSHVTLTFLQTQWHDMATFGTLSLFVFLGFSHFLNKETFARKVLGNTTPGTLGAIRMLTCFILLLNVLWENLPSSAAIPRELIKPLGVMNLFYALPIGFEYFVASPTLLLIFQVLTGVLLFLGMIGLCTRKVLPFAALFYLVFAGIFRQYAWFYHTGLIPVFVLFVLALTPSGDGWSLDRLRTVWNSGTSGDEKPAAIYGWSRYAIWLVIAIPYVGAGLSKLRNGGWFWWDAINFKHIMFYSTLRPMEFDFDLAFLFINAPDFIVEAMALVALLGEALYIFVLFSAMARIIFPGAMLLMHIGILYLQNILFFDLIILQVVYWDFTKIRKFFGKLLNKKYRRLTLIYDVQNNLWQRMILILKSMDLFERIIFSTELPKNLQTTDTVLPCVIQGKKVSSGAKALMEITWVLPALWFSAPVLYIISNVKSLSNSLVLYFEKKSSPETSKANPAKAPTSSRFANSPQLSIAILAILSLCWVFRIEFYPLTAMQMFSKFRHNIVQYELVKAHLVSGEVIRAPIEQSIEAMSDSRYRRILKMAFDERKQERCNLFLQACAEEWNKKATTDQKIVKMEVQRWKWDFIGDKGNSQHGDLIESQVFVVR